MSIVDSTEQFIRGLQNIERAIIEGLHKSGIHASADNFQWHRGKEFVPPPMAIGLEIKVNDKTSNSVLSREQVEDSWNQINRADVKALVKGMVSDLIS